MMLLLIKKQNQKKKKNHKHAINLLLLPEKTDPAGPIRALEKGLNSV